MPKRLRRAATAVGASRWFYPGLGALLGCASLIDTALLRRAPSILSILTLVAVAAAIGSCGRFPLAGPLTVAGLYAALGLPGLTDAAPDVSYLAPPVAAYVVAAHASRAVAVATLMALIASLDIATIPSGTWVPELYLPVGPWVVGAVMLSRRKIFAQLIQRKLELEHERDAFARLAARRERARIARELHDIVSHNMAVMVVQAGAGRIAPPEDPEHVAAIFRSIREAGGAALEELDQLVDVLGVHTTEAGARNTLNGIAALVAQARSAGLNVTAELCVLDSGVPAEVEQAAYRAIQEGLTNVLKHAPASHVELRVEARGQRLEIEVRNDAAAVDSANLAATGSGLGLAGLAERIQASGGELLAGPLPHGGWCFRVRLPARTAD